MSPMPDLPKKEKKTRRRLRLSCVECTKRRQRCDRVYPCGLCVSRGVSHLCRWENVPVARPTPARPPVMPSSGKPDSIQELSARIASLEKSVVAERLRNSRNQYDPTAASSSHSSRLGLPHLDQYSPALSAASLQSPSSENSPYSSPEPCSQDDEGESLALPFLSNDVHRTVSSLMQHLISQPGEYIGRGSSLSALYSISSREDPQLHHVSSTDPAVLFQPLLPDEQPSSSVLRLIQSLPSSATVASLCQSFFKDVNWCYGIPEQWFLTTCADMWTSVRYSVLRAQINPNWLCLLYAVLALAPRCHVDPTVDDMASAAQFFEYAMTARRVGESAYLIGPRGSAAQGSVLLCLAVPLLCDHLAERGYSNEAWKLVGHAILCAEAVGMHRDPSWCAWKKAGSEDVMGDTEKLLRRRAWWGLFIRERMYGLVLGRPVVRSDIADVLVPAPINADGTRNVFNVYQRHLIQLLSLAGEVVEKCFGIGSPSSAVVHEIDRKLEQWEQQLPPEFRADASSDYQTIPDDLDTLDLVTIARQRHTLSTWYLLCRLKLHTAYITSLDDSMMEAWGRPLACRKSRNLCISISSELIRFQCDAYATDVLAASSCFAGCFSLLEAAVALASSIAWQGSPDESTNLVYEATRVLEQVVHEAPGTETIARIGCEALAALIQELSGSHSKTVRPLSSPQYFDTPLMTSPHSTTSMYEWYSPDLGGFGSSSEYAMQPADVKDGSQYGSVGMQLPMLIPFADSKEGSVNCYDPVTRP
ncbi:hypothetical protein R3P38DRAFT_1175690 [Favolaschia claudopus]|uniref:Zn(2)-C6 fungal-type domain-containing protein n=1 Tax=Favolaschia claudopus TaxID=2862362 RepID=A0AAW0DX67_9AGAR